jgi:hypothetical protein
MWRLRRHRRSPGNTELSFRPEPAPTLLHQWCAGRTSRRLGRQRPASPSTRGNAALSQAGGANPRAGTGQGRRQQPQAGGPAPSAPARRRNRVRPNPTRSVTAAKWARPARLRQQERVARTRLLRTAPRRPGVAPPGAAARRSGCAPPRRGRHRRPLWHGFLAAVQRSWHAPAGPRVKQRKRPGGAQSRSRGKGGCPHTRPWQHHAMPR